MESLFVCVFYSVGFVIGHNDGILCSAGGSSLSVVQLHQLIVVLCYVVSPVLRECSSLSNCINLMLLLQLLYCHIVVGIIWSQHEILKINSHLTFDYLLVYIFTNFPSFCTICTHFYYMS